MSILQQQLSAIAANTSNQIDLKTQRRAHSKSLLFEPKVASDQDFNTIYGICYDGFVELCALDVRFSAFQSTLFSQQSVNEDRLQFNAEENNQLNQTLTSFMGLIGGRLLLRPAVKAIEWLVRRFRVQEFNTELCILTFLPYHTTELFATFLSILPSRLPLTYRFLHPYLLTHTSPPRQALVHALSRNRNFFTAFSDWILTATEKGHHYSALISFWACLTSESIAAMAERSRSGLKTIDASKTEDLLLLVLPIINKGLSMNNGNELLQGCCMIVTILISRLNLHERLLDTMLVAFATQLTGSGQESALIAVAIICLEKKSFDIPYIIYKTLCQIEKVDQYLIALSEHVKMDKLAASFIVAQFKFRDQVDETTTVFNLIDANLLSVNHVRYIINQAIKRLDVSQSSFHDAPNGVKSLLWHLSQSSKFRPILQDALQGKNINNDIFHIDDTTERTMESSPNNTPDLVMPDVRESEKNLAVEEVSKEISSHLANSTSFLHADCTKSYSTLSKIIGASASTPNSLSNYLEIIRSHLHSNAEQHTSIISFLLRFSLDSFAENCRVGSFEIFVGWMMSKVQNEIVDLQMIVPYLLVALSDKSKRIRFRAAQCLRVNKEALKRLEEKHKSKNYIIWAHDSLYGDRSDSMPLLNSKEYSKLLSIIIVPNLDECVLDKDQIKRILELCMNGSNVKREAALKSPDVELKSSFRNTLCNYLGSHAVKCVALKIKCCLFSMFRGGSKSLAQLRSRFLLPAVKDWASMTQKKVKYSCNMNNMDQSEVDMSHLELINHRDRESIECLQFLMNGGCGMGRVEMQELVFRYLRSLWSSKKLIDRESTAKLLLELTFKSCTGGHTRAIQALALETLQSINLSSNILVSFLDRLHELKDLSSKAINGRKRKLSRAEAQDEGSSITGEASRMVKIYASVLEVVEASQPKGDLQLLKALFRCLGEIQNLRALLQSELSYLQGMILNSLLAIVKEIKDAGSNQIDHSIIRADLVADCVRISSSPQVQNSAILLTAELATWIPEIVLHSIMPIFTFMGNSLIRQSDDYSSHILDQVLSKALPPIITKLNEQNGDFARGASEVILSFTAAYEHIPLQRRLRLFTQLVEALGAERSLHIISIALVARFPRNEDVRRFIICLFKSSNIVDGLSAAVNCIKSITDICQNRGAISETYLHLNDMSADQKFSLVDDLLEALSTVFSDEKLRKLYARMEIDPVDMSAIHTHYTDLVRSTMGMHKEFSVFVNPITLSKLMPSVLGLLPLKYLIGVAKDLLDSSNNEISRIILRSLESRLSSLIKVDDQSMESIIGFHKDILRVLQEASDPNLKIAAVSCIDLIGSKYGKKYPELTADAARVIIKPDILNNDDDQLRTAALLCLASLLDVLHHSFIPLLTGIMPFIFMHFEHSLKAGPARNNLHNASCAFVSAVLEHIPFVLSVSDIQTLLQLMQISATLKHSIETIDSRKQIYSLLIHKVDEIVLFTSIQYSAKGAILSGYTALTEYLGFAQEAVEHKSKSTIMKTAKYLFQTLLTLFDLRCLCETEKLIDVYDQASIGDAEQKTNEMALTIIMKLNDKMFRPYFIQLVDWASKKPMGNREMKQLRLTSFFIFFSFFNEKLGSIVTNYSAYIIDVAKEILSSTKYRKVHVDSLFKATLQGLHKCFDNDQDGFWQIPSHFDALMKPLVSQLSVTSANLVDDTVIPAIASFASAANSDSHQKELNSELLHLMRSDKVQIRISAIKCEQSLTSKLGEEWLSLLPEMLPLISEMQEDDDENVEREIQRWIKQIEEILGEKLDPMLQ